MNELAIRNAALAIRPDQERFDSAQLAALKQAGLGAVDQANLDMYFFQCKRTALDPFARQIYLIKRGGGYSIQTSIDGFRLIATRTGVYVGSEESWERDDNGKVLSATVTVYRLVAGVRCPFSATAHFSEYSQGGNMWQKYPARMIAKCAESLALRKAFPLEMSGIYTDDEMPSEAPVRESRSTILPPPRDIEPVAEEFEMPELSAITDRQELVRLFRIAKTDSQREAIAARGDELKRASEVTDG